MSLKNHSDCCPAIHHSVESLWSPILSFALDRKITRLPCSCSLSSKPRYLKREIVNEVKEAFESTHLFLQRELRGAMPTSIGSVSQICDLAVWLLAACIPNSKAGWFADVLDKSHRITDCWARCVLLSAELIDLRTGPQASNRKTTSATEDLVEGLCDLMEGEKGIDT